MTQENVETQKRSAMRTGGIALIFLGALLAGVVVATNSHEYQNHRELRAKTPSEPRLDVAGDGVLAFANEQLLVAANSNDLAATNSELLSETPSNRRHLTGGSGSGSGSGSDAPTNAPTSSPTPAPTTSPVPAPTATPTTTAPTTSPTTTAPTSAPTSPGPSYDQSSQSNVEVTTTLSADYSTVLATDPNLAAELAYTMCDLVGADVGYSTWRHSNCVGTMQAGSTIIIVVIFANGATIAQIQTVQTASFSTVAQMQTLFSGMTLTGSYTVTAIETTSTEYSTKKSSKLSTGALVGIIVGSVVGVALIGAVIFLVVKKGGSPKGSTAPEY